MDPVQGRDDRVSTHKVLTYWPGSGRVWNQWHFRKPLNTLMFTVLARSRPGFEGCQRSPESSALLTRRAVLLGSGRTLCNGACGRLMFREQGAVLAHAIVDTAAAQRPPIGGGVDGDYRHAEPAFGLRREIDRGE